MDAMVGCLIAPINQRVAAFNHLDTAVGLRKRSKMGIILPELRAKRSNVRPHIAQGNSVKVADSGCQQHMSPGASELLRISFRIEFPPF